MTAQQLKNSILQMAIQGKLVSQDPSDEPASILLKRIKAEKDALIKSGKLKRDKHESIITRDEDGHYIEKKDGKTIDITDELPFDIPENWTWVRLFSITIFLHRGKSPKYTNIRKYPMFAQKCNKKDGIHMENALFCNPDQYNGFQKEYQLQDSDVVINSTGTGTLGRVGIFYKEYLGEFESTVPDSHVTLVRGCQPFVIGEYLFACFRAPFYQNAMLKNADGSTNQKELYTKVIENYLLPLPPLAEQKRIVAKIEGLFPHLEEYDRAETEVRKLNEEFPDMLKKSILQSAIQGKLVPQDLTDEPASELLKRIKAEKNALIKSGVIKRDKRESVITRDEDGHFIEKKEGKSIDITNEIPFDIPDSWEWVRLGSLFHISPRNDVEDEADVGFMPMPLLQDGFRNSHSFEVRKWRQVKNGFTHFMNGDIVIAKITPCFQNRKSAIISNLPNEYGAGTTELHVLRDETHLLCLRYFLWIFKTHAFIESGVKHFTGTAGQQRIGKDFLSDYLVPLPPLAEQKRIVEKLDAVLSTLQPL